MISSRIDHYIKPTSTHAKALVTALALVFAGSIPALAIPSPELVIGSISSISQLIALVSAMLGGGAAAVGVRARLKNGNVNGGKRTFQVAAVLFVVAFVSVGFNYYQYTTGASEEQARLQATLIRPARAPGTQILDKSLKVTPLSKQKDHPLGISTSDAAKLLSETANGERSDTLFIDVREGGENEMGTLPGTRHIRFPDISASKIDFTGKKAILMCYNGNRSSETCERLAKLGIDCKFIVGGIEKWIVEGRSFTDKSVRSLSNLRALPSYNNQKVLFSTKQVTRLITGENAQFVDVRYPGEFKNARLPGAINIPLRATPSVQLASMIKQLPKKPIIAACYDRRGCFISEVLGLELTRAGYDYRGRYTLPWEYFVPPAPKPHIAAWLASSQKGLWQNAIDLLATFIGWMAGYGGLLFAIIAISAISRLLVLPISLKAERDQIIVRNTGDEFKALKHRLKDDPKRLSRAIQAFYRDHGLTPLRNLLALAFLPLMMLGLSAVQLAATENPVSLWWFADISKPDPYYVLPVVFAVLGCLYIQSALTKTRKQALLAWAIGFPLLAGLVLLLSAAGGLYLVASIGFLLIQRAWVTGWFGGFGAYIKQLKTGFKNRRICDGIIPLASTELLTDCGNKSYRLSALMSKGLAVPDGVVLNRHFIKKFMRTSAGERNRLVNKVWKMVNTGEVAVRSSAAAEDGSAQSFAGVFDSQINVTHEGLEDAICNVAASFSSKRIADYGSNENMSDEGNILVQKMIDADYAGVLFTRAPESPGMMMVEVVEGTADVLVSGMAVPEMFRFGRYSHQSMDENSPPIDLGPLISMAKEVEGLFSAPQDIEWTYLGGQFLIVQSRDITTLKPGSKAEHRHVNEWQRLLNEAKKARPEEIVFKQDEMSEVLPRPTPLSLDMMQTLWANGGSVDHAARALGLAYDAGENAPSRLTTIFGRLYTNMQQATKTAIVINRACSIRLKKNGSRIADEYYQKFLPRFDNEMNLLESANFDKLPTGDLLELTKNQWQGFVTGTHVEVEMINIAASFHMTNATTEIEKAGLDPAALLATTPEAGPAKAMAEAGLLPKAEIRPHLLAEMGHRAAFDYELAEPRYREKPERLDNICAALNPPQPDREPASEQGIQDNLPKPCADALRLARLYQSLKEDAKHQSLRQFALIRQLLMAIDRRFNLSGLSFFLTFEEVISLNEETCAELRKIAKTRRKTRRRFLKEAPLASSLDLVQLEKASSKSTTREDIGEGEIGGSRVSGSKVSIGRAYVVSAKDAEQGKPLKAFRDGDILVCTMVHPAWLPYVLRSGGVVCEVGGWLSHIAIVAREHDVAMIVGTRCMTNITSDDLLTLELDGKVEIAEAKELATANAAE